MDLLVRKVSHWILFTFNSFESILNWFSFQASNMIRKNFQFKSIHFKFIWIYFSIDFPFKHQRSAIDKKKTYSIEIHSPSIIWIYFQHQTSAIDKKKMLNLSPLTFNLVESILFSIDCTFKHQRKTVATKHVFNWTPFTFNSFESIFNWFSPFDPQLCTIRYHEINCIGEYLGHSWGTFLKLCLGAIFLIWDMGVIRHPFFWKPCISRV